MRYETPQAFERALSYRLKHRAAEEGGISTGCAKGLHSSGSWLCSLIRTRHAGYSRAATR